MLTKAGKAPPGTWLCPESAPANKLLQGLGNVSTPALHLQTPLPQGPCVFLQLEEGYGRPNSFKATCLLATVYLLLALGEKDSKPVKSPALLCLKQSRPELTTMHFRNEEMFWYDG